MTKGITLPLSLKFIIGCSAALIAALGISFTFLAHRQERLIMEQVERRPAPCLPRLS